MKHFVGFLILLPVLLMVLVVISWRYSTVSRIQSPVHATNFSGQAEKFDGVPTKIEIPSLQVTMDVYPAQVRENSWDIFDNAASWLSTSGRIHTGNMVIYAHNDQDAFGGLKNLSDGDKIIAYSGTTKAVFEFAQGFDAKATDIQHVTQSDSRLTLYTCDGFFDVKRYFALASLVRIEN